MEKMEKLYGMLQEIKCSILWILEKNKNELFSEQVTANISMKLRKSYTLKL